MNRRRFLKLTGLALVKCKTSSIIWNNMPRIPTPASLINLAENPTTDSQTMIDALDNLIVPIMVGDPLIVAALSNSLDQWADEAIYQPLTDDRLGLLSFLFLAFWHWKKWGNDKIEIKVKAWLKQFWESYPAWQWDRPDEPNIEVRMTNARYQRYTPKRYYNLIKDEDMFFLATIADVAAYNPNVLWLRRAAKFSRDYIRERFYRRNNNFLFQPGYWSDHPLASAYVAETALQTELGASPDMEHLVRWGLWHESLGTRRISPFFRRLKKNHENYLLNNVFTRLTVSGRSVPVCKNWSDGNNSSYTPGTTRLPYQTSIGFLTGWFVFFDSEYWRDFYSDVANALLNIDANILYYYGGVLSASLQNRILTNGLAEPWLEERVYLCQLAAENWNFNFRRR